MQFVLTSKKKSRFKTLEIEQKCQKWRKYCVVFWNGSSVTLEGQIRLGREKSVTETKRDERIAEMTDAASIYYLIIFR
jgi:hypothetical protein